MPTNSWYPGAPGVVLDQNVWDATGGTTDDAALVLVVEATRPNGVLRNGLFRIIGESVVPFEHASTNGLVRTATEYQQSLYVAGDFTLIDGQAASGIALEWRGFDPLGAGARTLASATRVRSGVWNGDLYAGAFLAAVASAASIAKWNGSRGPARCRHHAVGLPGRVSSLVIITRTVSWLVGGSFPRNGQPAHNLTAWDGAAWTVIPGMPTASNGQYPDIANMTVHEDSLFRRNIPQQSRPVAPVARAV
jgi:hypothetical protein